MTLEQLKALMYAYADVSAIANAANDKDYWDWEKITVLGTGAAQTKKDLEKAFPFLLEEKNK